MTVEHAYWLYFCQWYDSEQEHFLCGEQYQNPKTLTELYQSDFCITLAELPKDLYKSGNNEQPSTSTSTTSKNTTTTTTTITTTVTSTTTSSSITTTPIDVKFGDANCDGEIDMSDAVLIMQSLANPNKYGVNGSDSKRITEKGMKNADVDITAKGVTSNDALRIQEFLLGKIKSLDPEEK